MMIQNSCNILSTSIPTLPLPLSPCLSSLISFSLKGWLGGLQKLGQYEWWLTMSNSIKMVITDFYFCRRNVVNIWSSLCTISKFNFFIITFDIFSILRKHIRVMFIYFEKFSLLISISRVFANVFFCCYFLRLKDEVRINSWLSYTEWGISVGEIWG